MAKIFVTGATGYIGGDALYEILHAHPEYEVTCLVRSPERGAKVVAQYPKTRLVYGDLDSYDLIKEESANADIVCHFADCDHEASAQAIIDGLSQHSTEKPGYLVHTSGTGILVVEDMVADRFGESSSKIYDDWDNVSEVTNMRDEAWHRKVDKIVLAGAKQDSIRTAIVCPPTIYGPGRGPANSTSDQWPSMTAAVLETGKGLYVGKGDNVWNFVHVHDLSNLYLRLVEAAATNGGGATWDEGGYYFAENGEFVWGEMAKAIAEEAHKQGFTKSPEAVSISKEEGLELKPMGSYKWGLNSRGRAIRARKVLDWEPKGPSPKEELAGLITTEAKRLGLVKGHAEVAAGNA